MYSTIPELLAAAAADSPESEWLITDDSSWTFGQASLEVDRFAAGLVAMGVVHGDRVILVARNEPRCVFVWLALMRLGAIQVPINPAASEAEFAGFVDQVRPRLVLNDADLDVLERNPAGLVPEVNVSPDDLAVFIPTSGTTGRSKLVMQTHRAYAWAGESFPWWMQLTSEDRMMTSLPLFHINAPTYSVLGSIAARASLVLLPRFSGSDFIAAARRHDATQFNAIGAMLEILMRQPERPDDADNPLRLCYTGPSPTEQRQRQIEERFGFEIVCGYALSESPFGLIWRHGVRPFGTLGWPRQHPELGVVNEARVVAGELQLKNPTVMRGYFERPDETASVLVDGWLHTGDLVESNDDGSFTFVGRRKEVIRRRGENLSPVEVEACLESHPDVTEAAVIGVPSEMSEEEVKAFVIAAPNRSIDVQALHHHAQQQLARFKVPRYFEVVSELPHTPTGRLAKHQLSPERNDQEVDCD